MLLSFEVENYNSFSEATKVEFTVGAQAPDNFMFAPVASSEGRVTKVLGIFGPNASGKSSLLRVLPSVASFITDSFSYKLDAPLPIEPHFFSNAEEVSVTFEFELPGEIPQLYRYQLVATPNRVLLERLRIKGSRVFSRVFERKWAGEAGYHVSGLGDKFTANLRENVSWLSWLVQHNVPEAIRLVEYFRNIRSNIEARGVRMPTFFTALTAIDHYRTEPACKESLVRQLNRWDIDIEDVEFSQMQMPNSPEESTSRPWMAYCVHRKGEKRARLPIHAESSGTLGLFSLLSIIQPVLDKGGIAVIDELEADLHPHMLEAVIDLFVRPETNPRNAQLVFTSHADWIMNVLHKTQIVLVEKEEGESTAVRLSDIKGIEARENYSARYRSGAYGAIPDLH